MSTAPFVERWRPQDLDSIVLSKEIKDRLKAFVTTGDFPAACIYYGEPGLGKSTSALAVVKEYFVRRGIYSPDTTLEQIRANAPKQLVGAFVPSLFVASRTQGTIDFVKGTLTKFLQGAPPAPGIIKFVVMDEADGASKDALEALLPLIERYSSSRFLFTTNAEPVFGLGPAIVSRAAGCTYEFSKPSKQDIIAHLKNIAQEEGVTLSEQSFNSIADTAKDVREAVGMLGSDIALVRSKEEKEKPKFVITKEELEKIPVAEKAPPPTSIPSRTKEEARPPAPRARITDADAKTLEEAFRAEMALRGIPLKSSTTDYLAVFKAYLREATTKGVSPDRFKSNWLPNIVSSIEEVYSNRTTVATQEVTRRIVNADARFKRDDILDFNGEFKRILEVKLNADTGTYEYQLEGVEGMVDESLLKPANIPRGKYQVGDNLVYNGKGHIVQDRRFDSATRKWVYTLKLITVRVGEMP